jgi:hypothetical protein
MAQNYIESTASALKDSALPKLRQARSEIENVDRRARSLAQQHPVMAFGAALAFGYVCGRIISRA